MADEEFVRDQMEGCADDQKADEPGPVLMPKMPRNPLDSSTSETKLTTGEGPLFAT